MKTEDKHREIEPLLDALEHHGRDLRRQQQLAAMIDSMAASEKNNESGRWKNVRIWSLRVAAAACVLFFIATAVRIWFIPIGAPSNTMAVAEVPAATSTITDSTAIAPHTLAPSPTSKPRHIERKVKQQPQPEPMVEEMPATEELLAVVDEPTTPEAEMETMPESEQFEDIVQPITSIEQPATGTEASPALAQSTTETATERAPRQSIWRGLFHRSEPSRMDGTMLAINLL